jgi:NAD(P)-dependent dehydrogenase (short-subunit alcohol dehydrogenase family)
MSSHNRVFLITGTRRIGAVLAKQAAIHGADVALVYRSSDHEAREAATTVEAAGHRAALIQADLADAQACEHVVAETIRTFGRLDVLVNMASVYRPMPLAEIDASVWDAALAVDLRASFLCSRAAMPHLRKAGGGHIINVADWLPASGRPRYQDFVPYYVAKAGVIALTEALALELAPDHILVNAVAPGPILPPAGASDAEVQAVEASTPLGRWGGPDAVVQAVLYLASSDFVTGETIRVDGGRHLK